MGIATMVKQKVVFVTFMDYNKWFKAASFSLILTDWLCLQVAQMPRSRDLAIFVVTTADRQTNRLLYPWACEQGKNQLLYPCACVRGNEGKRGTFYVNLIVSRDKLEPLVGAKHPPGHVMLYNSPVLYYSFNEDACAIRSGLWIDLTPTYTNSYNIVLVHCNNVSSSIVAIYYIA